MAQPPQGNNHNKPGAETSPAMFIAIGIGVGVAFGTALGNPALGIGVGIAVGAGLAGALKARSDRKSS